MQSQGHCVGIRVCLSSRSPAGQVGVTGQCVQRVGTARPVWGQVSIPGSDLLPLARKALSALSAGLALLLAPRGCSIAGASVTEGAVAAFQDRALRRRRNLSAGRSGGCDPTDLAAYPDQRLQEFVCSAAMEIASARHFSGPALSSDPRWKHGPIHIIGINAETGTIQFSGNPASFLTSGRIPELLFDGGDASGAGALFSESLWYCNFNNPVTGDDEARVGS